MDPGLLDGFKSVVGILGVTGTITLCALGVLVLLVMGYMFLRFGEQGLRMLLPFMREIIKTFRSEARKAHPAIRLELCFHIAIIGIVIFCLGATLLHALMPWMRPGVDHLLEEVFITCLVLFVLLASVSITLAIRLK